MFNYLPDEVFIKGEIIGYLEEINESDIHTEEQEEDILPEGKEELYLDECISHFNINEKKKAKLKRLLFDQFILFSEKKRSINV